MNVPGIGGASIHSPDKFWTCSPRWGEACNNCTSMWVVSSIEQIVIIAHECQESGIIMWPHTLIRSIVSDRVLHDFRPMLHLLWQIIEASEPFGA